MSTETSAAAGNIHFLDYVPRKEMIAFHSRLQRYAILVTHRQFGKTVATIRDTLIRASQHIWPVGTNFVYIGPTQKQAKLVAWRYFKDFVGPFLADTKNAINETTLHLDLKSGARIHVLGAENAENLRGIGLSGVVLDEFASFPPNVMAEIIMPMLSYTGGWATFVGTPKGRNEFYELYQKAVADPEHWFSLLLTAEQSGVLSEEQLANQRKFQSPEQYAQEFCCDFQAAIVGSYYGKLMAAAEQEGRIRKVEPIDGAPIHTAWDLGVRDSTAIWAFQVVGPAAQGEEGEIHILGYYENNGEPISHYVQELAARDWCGGVDWLPHDARMRSSDTLRTRIETLVRLGRNPAIAPEQKFQDGIEAARLTIPKCLFDETECSHGLKALRAYSQRWDDKKKTYLERPDHNWASHGADAWRYLSCSWREVPALKPPCKALSYEKARWAPDAQYVPWTGPVTYDIIDLPDREREERA